MSNISIYAARESGLHNLNPITKLVLALFLLICGFVLPGPWASYLILILIIIPLAALGKVLNTLMRLVLSVSWPLVLSVFIIQTLFWGKGTILFEIGPLAPKLEGAVFAFTSTGRILFIMADFMLFSLTTRPDTLMISLKQAGMPSGLAYIIVTTLQLVPRFITKARTILDAQRSRGLETQGDLFVRARALLPLVMPLVIGSLVEVEERAIAIEARAFNSNRKETSLLEIPDTPFQRIVRWSLMIGAILAIAIRFIWLS
jgi:energy-coupling factor transport system permease protein